MMLLEAVLMLVHMISLGRHPGNVFFFMGSTIATDNYFPWVFSNNKRFIKKINKMYLLSYADASEFKTF